MGSQIVTIRAFWLIALFLCATFAHSSVRSVFVCECQQLKSPDEELKRATAVFAGEVSGVKTEKANPTERDSLMVEIKVERVWKGEIGSGVTVQTAAGAKACGYQFGVGKKYLVYVHGRETLSVSRCSRTKQLESASEDLKELGEGKQPN